MTAKKWFVIFSLFLSGLLISCGPANTNENQTPEQNNGYPGEQTSTPASYPAVTIPEYPGPQVTYDESRRFTINEPIHVGDQLVSGTGPANIPIKVVNVSYLGEVLGTGQTGTDGSFSINLSAPVELQHVIGIQLNDQSLDSDFRNNPGPDYSDFPMVGLILTSAIVQP
jgi:hypothetical protein